MMQPFNQKDHDAAMQKMSLIKSFIGPDLDMALTVLAYTILNQLGARRADH